MPTPPPGTPAFLEIADLCLQYPGATGLAVDGVSLTLGAGDLGVLIGPSGCGKTTLLRAVAGLEHIGGGHIDVAGERVSARSRHVPVEQRRIGLVFQDHALFPHLDVAGNVAFGLLGRPRTGRAERVAGLLALVGLDGLQDRFPHELSGGQQQRVALARALAPEPRLLLLDEPFANLDVALREHLAHEVRAILKTAHTTALFVTHDQQEAFALGDVIGVMHAGRLEQWADAETLYRRPASRFVAGFVGHGAFVPAQIRRLGDDTVVQTPLGALRRAAADLRPGITDEVGLYDLLLRPEDVVCDDAAPLKARIVRSAFRGAHHLCTLQLPSGETVMAHVPPPFAHMPGGWLGIRVRSGPVLVFERTASTRPRPSRTTTHPSFQETP